MNKSLKKVQKNGITEQNAPKKAEPKKWLKNKWKTKKTAKNRWKSKNWSQKDTPDNTSTLLCSIGQICTTLYSTVPYFSVLYSTEHSCTFQYSTVIFRVALYSTAGYCAALKSFVYSCTAQ